MDLNRDENLREQFAKSLDDADKFRSACVAMDENISLITSELVDAVELLKRLPPEGEQTALDFARIRKNLIPRLEQLAIMSGAIRGACHELSVWHRGLENVVRIST